MCPPCPRPPVHHVPGTYTGRHGRQRLSKHVQSRDGRLRRQACVEARPTSAAGRAGPPEASSSSLCGSIESVLLSCPLPAPPYNRAVPLTFVVGSAADV